MKINPKILTLDIETRPAKAYVWGLFDQNIGLSQLIEPSAPICFAAKFLGEKTVHFHSDWDDGHTEMIKKAHELISSADAVVGYNSDAFDLRKLRGEFILAGLNPPPPTTSIDLLKHVRKLGFQSNKLAFIGPMVGIGKKIETEGFSLWTAVIDGNPAAQKRMEKYCIGDVTLTEKLYTFLRSYIPNHPHLGESNGECGACGGNDLQKRGFYRTKSFKTQRLQCQDCGSWSTGARKKV